MSKRTPLYEEHLKAHGKIVDFAGWEMPVQYAGVMEEHRAVRTKAGIFDVSHMGQFEFSGKDAFETVQRLTTNDVSKMYDGRAQYSILCNERGTVVDDIIVYRISEEEFMFVVNASNKEKDFAWCKDRLHGDTKIRDLSDNFALIALQGPAAIEMLQKLTKTTVSNMAPYHFKMANIANCNDCIAATTGYTGERGFEIFSTPDNAPKIWSSLIELGAQPAGLGARDTLRMEMKFSLYGHEITDQTNPLEAGLGWVVKLGKTSDFIGKKALLSIDQKNAPRTLVGFKMVDRGIPRQGYPIVTSGTANGIVTSGTMSPSLDYAIGIGYVPTAQSSIGGIISIDIRGQLKRAEIVQTPFYKH